MKNKMLKLLLVFVIGIITLIEIKISVTAVEGKSMFNLSGVIGVGYKAFIDNQGSTDWIFDDNLGGTQNKGIGLNGLRIQLVNAAEGAGIEYQVLKDAENGKQWSQWIADGELAGFEENGKNIYAIKIRLKNMDKYSVEYRVHRKYQGWENDYVSDGEIAGTEYTNSRLEGIKIRIVPKINKQLEIKYKGYTSSNGYQEFVRNDILAGTENKGIGLSGIRIELANAPTGAGIEYQVLKDAENGKQWTGWITDGDLAGFEESEKNIYAIRIRLKNLNNYSVEYRVHRKYQGWENNYVSDGEIAGTEYTSSRLEGIKIRILPKIRKSLEIKYKGYTSSNGYQEFVRNDILAGTENKGIGLNGIRIELANAPAGAGIEYQVLKDEENGKQWTGWITDGDLAGFEESEKNIYAIRIRLKNLNNYSVEYRVHRKYQGWENNYVSDGEIAGTEYTSSRLEGIKIRILPKIRKSLEIKYKGYTSSNGYQEFVRNDILAGTENKGIGLNGIRIELANAPAEAGIEYQVLGDSENGKQWSEWISNGELAGFEENGKNIYAIKIRLKNLNNYSVEYRVHRKYQGWESNYVSDGEIAGTEYTNSRLEGIKIRIVPKIRKALEIKYKGYTSNNGYHEFVKNDALAGTENRGIGLNGIRIELANAPAGAGIEYQVLADCDQGKEWLPWVSDGELAGFEETRMHLVGIVTFVAIPTFLI